MGNIHEVDFYTYCKTCKNKDNKEDDANSPCYECLDEPVNVDSRKPLYYDKAD